MSGQGSTIGGAVQWTEKHNRPGAWQDTCWGVSGHLPCFCSRYGMKSHRYYYKLLGKHILYNIYIQNNSWINKNDPRSKVTYTWFSILCLNALRMLFCDACSWVLWFPSILFHIWTLFSCDCMILRSMFTLMTAEGHICNYYTRLKHFTNAPVGNIDALISQGWKLLNIMKMCKCSYFGKISFLFI